MLQNLVVRLFLSETAIASTNSGNRDKDYSELLGLWYNVFPLSLTDIAENIKADSAESKNMYIPPSGRCVSLPPFRVQANNPAFDAAAALELEAVEKHNAVFGAFQDKLSLVASHGSDHVGGVCHSTSTDLAGVLKRFYCDTFTNFSSGYGRSDKSCLEKTLGVVSRHRRMRRACDSNGYHLHSMHTLDYILDNSEILSAANFDNWIRKMMRTMEGMNGFMSNVENLGHDEVGHVEGLKVELLAFQRQSVKWAVERENLPGGIQSLFWPKLPGTSLYYNPLLKRFRNDKPQIARGGFIAEEMGRYLRVLLLLSNKSKPSSLLPSYIALCNLGLGKTVISLAVILKNPAPASPVSGSSISCLTERANNGAAGSSVHWDKDLYQQTSSGNTKRGSILSRGTLVVCPVSLVGQWVEEAKSKLDNPGLVYPYHGQSRKRDADILAKKDIVVTTYQVLSSGECKTAFRVNCLSALI